MLRVQKAELQLEDTKILGSGSSCIVFEALYRGEPCAVKIYHPHVVDQIERELEVVENYINHHHHIVRVFAIVVDDRMGPKKNVGLVLELCSTTLDNVVNDSVPLCTRLKWLCQLASAVQCAHDSRVIHSDIKPSNVLMARDPTTGELVVKLCDFGSALAMTTTGATSMSSRGTPLFMAPEYTTGCTGPTTEADVFGFGMTMWYVFFPGVDHGLGRSAAQILHSLDSAKRPELRGLPSPLVDVVRACWAQDASLRPSISAVLEKLVQAATAAEGRLSLVQSLASTKLWIACLGVNALPQLGSLEWAVNDGTVYSNRITDVNHACYRFVCQNTRSGFDTSQITSVVMVSQSGLVVDAFIKLHQAQAHHSSVRRDSVHTTSPAHVAALALLSRFYLATDDEHQGGPGHIVLAWHGVPAENVERVCRNGPDSYDCSDGCPFGAGSYFSLEAAYAARYSTPEATTGECAVILFAVSVSQVKVVTPELDYRLHENPATPHLHGYSKFYSGDRNTSMALAPRCDAHFIPVKYYGRVHPRTGQPIPNDVDFQAVDEASGAAEAHELVVSAHQRCMPLAVVYFTRPSATSNSGNERVFSPWRQLSNFPRVSLKGLQVGEEVGAGSSGKIHKVTHCSEPYALKLYHPPVVDAIEQELAVVPFLQHPNIVRVVSLVEDDLPPGSSPRVIGLLMELCGASLDVVLLNETISLDARVMWLHESSKAVSFAHSSDIVHSDIKPANILVSSHHNGVRTAKVTSFSAAFVLSTSAGKTATKGAPLFMAPEYAAGVTGPTKAADVFSFGMTMWSLLFPRVRHGMGNSDAEITRSLREGLRPPVHGVTSALIALIESCWAQDPATRPTMDEIEGQLRASVESTTQQRCTPLAVVYFKR